jgi:hypothetical protein
MLPGLPRPQGLRALVGALVLTAAFATGAPAQEHASHSASPFLPADHWAVGAVLQITKLGLADPNFGWGDGSLTAEAVGRVLHDAAANAARIHPDFVPIAEGYWTRFAGEFPITTQAIEPRLSRRTAYVAEGWASAAYSEASGRLYPVRSIDHTRDNVSGPFPRPDLSELGISAQLSATMGRFFAAAIAPEHHEHDWSIREGYVLASWKQVGIWAGRRAPAFRTGTGGGIVLNGTAAFTGGGITLTEPIRLPWIFRHLGPIRYEGFLSQIDSSASVKRPWFITSHASISPHPRLLIGATQAFMFGGEGVAPFTWRNFLAMFTSHGINSAGTEFEDGVASGEIRFRPPVPLLPITLYLEWGAEDNHSAWVLFPGRIIGAQVPAVPGLPALSLGFEHAEFSGPCTTCGSCECKYYATWYRHTLFKDGWTLDREPIGHPLDGQGYEWLLYGTWDDPASRLRLDARAFLRYRGPYNNYSPTHEGRSIGGQVSTVYRTTRKLDLVFDGAFENGKTGWHESSLSTGLRWSF